MESGGNYTFGSLFAGIGGICIAFSEEGFTVKWSNEIDKYACQTYRHNQSHISKELDITEQDVRDFDPPCKVDVLGGGFPCQPYSVAGPMRGLKDKRGRPMFDEIIRIAGDTEPRVIFLENVGNLLNFDNKQTFPVMLDLLREAGYSYHFEEVLNSKDYSGIAQNRSRIYIAVFKFEDDYNEFRRLYDTVFGPIEITKKYDQIVSKGGVPEKYYYSKDTKGTCRSVRYEEHFVPYVTKPKVFYQYRRDKMRENKSGLCPALTASMGCGGHNVPIILDGKRIRKLTPQECLKVQGFPDWFEFPEGMADSHKYKQAGNSVTVPLIERFASLIRQTLENVDRANGRAAE